MIKIKCSTLFDITATGITGHFRQAQVPFRDRAGHEITDQRSWDRARNQQRNWETLTQIIGLRTQADINIPVLAGNIWEFDFTAEINVFDNGTDPVGVLKSDANGVPMLGSLDNRLEIDSVLITSGPKQNIWFEPMPINNTLEN